MVANYQGIRGMTLANYIGPVSPSDERSNFRPSVRVGASRRRLRQTPTNTPQP